MKTSIRLYFLTAAACGLAGCAGAPAARTSAPEHAKPAASFLPTNFVGERSLPSALLRVLVLPVHGGQFVPPETCEYLDPIFSTALEQQERFEVVTLSRDECGKSFGAPDIASTDSLPADFLSRLGTEYGAQGVMFVDITAFDPYRPLTLGIRAKLAAVADRHLIWSFDDVFCCLNPGVVGGLRRYYSKNSQPGAPVDLSSDDLVSPRRFALYAADTAFETLPKR
jgi:hypothetical protein